MRLMRAMVPAVTTVMAHITQHGIIFWYRHTWAEIWQFHFHPRYLEVKVLPSLFQVLQRGGAILASRTPYVLDDIANVKVERLPQW